jgi:hypothetical protein
VIVVIFRRKYFFSKNEDVRRDFHVFVTNYIEGSPVRMVDMQKERSKTQRNPFKRNRTGKGDPSRPQKGWKN